MPRSLWTFFLLLILLPVTADAQAATELLEHLRSAAQLSNLSVASIQPWHAKEDVDFLDLKGTVKDHGTVEKWWAAPDRYRVSISSPSYTAIETRNGREVFRTIGRPRIPDLYELLLAQISDPFAGSSMSEGFPNVVEDKVVGKVNLKCIMPLSPTFTSVKPHLGQYTTYCLDSTKPDLRLMIRYGDQLILRDRMGTFQNRHVALDLTVMDVGKTTLRSHLSELATYTPGDHDFDATAEQQAVPIVRPLSAALVADTIVTKVAPVYPLEARVRHISGTVVLRVLVGKDGHVQDLLMVRSPDNLLTSAATDAVRQWRFNCPALDGESIAVETVVVINFSFH